MIIKIIITIITIIIVIIVIIIVIIVIIITDQLSTPETLMTSPRDETRKTIKKTIPRHKVTDPTNLDATGSCFRVIG